MKRLALVLGLVGLMVAGCDTSETCGPDCGDGSDRQPPAVPTGVGSITGDGYVVIFWNPVYVSDLAGYGVYRSYAEPGPYTRIGEVDRGEETSFVDETAVNGVTYYYAVDAFDFDGNESALSYETVDDTPRSEGWDAEWFTRQYDPDASAIAILPDDYDTLVLLGFQHPLAQYYLTRDGEGCMRIVPLGLNLIQDYGYTYSEDDLDEAPTHGWSTCTGGVEVILNHTYVLRTATHYYGKIRVEEMGPQGVRMYWAFQGVRGLTELAPPMRSVGPKRG